jgi:hypothetical protein
VADAIGPPIKAALADQIREAVGVEFDEIQVEPFLVWRPTPPTIDVYPASPYQSALAFGAARIENELRFTVRARIGTPDHLAAQAALDELCDPVGDASVALAIEADPTLGGACAQAIVTEGPSEWGVFPATDGAGDLMGATWTVTVTP